jgi:tetratricopeptide (TPR) repeat protein
MPGATSFTAHARLGTVALLAGEIELASSEFRKALHDKPDHVEAHLGAIEVLLEAGRPAEALQELQTILSPDCADAWLLGSACADALGHAADAALFLDRAREIRATQPWIAPHRRGRMAELETRLRPSLVRQPASAREVGQALTASVVIPAYNRLDLLRPVLEGFLRERRTSAFELLVVDDGSTPPVQQLADSLGAPPSCA